jgi:hypothetical protein
MTTPHRGYPRVGDNTLADGKARINALADAVDADVAGLVSGMRLAAVLVYTSTGSFAKGNYPGIKAVEVEVVGGGGGSGYAAATNGSQISWGMGGAGAAWAYGNILAGALSSSETVTVGAAGTGGTSGTPDGGNGGTSSFGAHLTATGGQGGNDVLQSTAAGGTSNGNSGGTPGGTALQLGVAGEGDDAVTFVTGYFESVTGLAGKRSGGPYGATNHPTLGPVTSGFGSQGASAGLGYGSGARGPVRGTSSSANNGAAGAPGRVIVRVYV